MRTYHEGLIYYSAGSPPSKAHDGGWEGLGWDGGEPAPQLSIRPDIFLSRKLIHAFLRKYFQFIGNDDKLGTVQSDHRVALGKYLKIDKLSANTLTPILKLNDKPFYLFLLISHRFNH